MRTPDRWPARRDRSAPGPQRVRSRLTAQRPSAGRAGAAASGRMESASKVETRRLQCVLQRGKAGLEQIDAMVRVPADAGDEPRFHDRRIADNRKKPASG